MEELSMSMLKKSKLSAYVITYNEEPTIEACLQSIKWADELIIVDSFSTDGTINVARKYTNKIYFHKYENNLTKQRNYALTKISYDWILTIDGDEKLENNAEYIIREYILKSKICGYWLPRKQYIKKSFYLKHGIFYPDWQLRVFKKIRNLKYINGPIHENLTIPEQSTLKVNSPTIYHDPIHTKYDSFLSFKRFFPYISIEGKEFAKKNNKSNMILIEYGFMQIVKEFYWSVIKYNGYKDGYPGLRAALIYACYKGSVYFYVAFKRIFK